LLKKSELSSWVFTAMRAVHIRKNSSLNPPKNPESAYVSGCEIHGAAWQTSKTSIYYKST